MADPSKPRNPEEDLPESESAAEQRADQSGEPNRKSGVGDIMDRMTTVVSGLLKTSDKLNLQPLLSNLTKMLESEKALILGQSTTDDSGREAAAARIEAAITEAAAKMKSNLAAVSRSLAKNGGKSSPEMLEELERAKGILKLARTAANMLRHGEAPRSADAAEEDEKTEDHEDSLPETPEAEALKKALEKIKEAMQKEGQKKEFSDFIPPDEPQMPPQQRKKLSPSMDERKKSKEKGGEAAIFTITPPLKGYFIETVMDRFNARTVEWESTAHEQPFPSTVAINPQHVISGQIEGKICLPLPEGYSIDLNTLHTDGTPVQITYDAEHETVILSSETRQGYNIAFGPIISRRSRPYLRPGRTHHEDMITGDLCAETNTLLQLTSMEVSPQKKAEMIAAYVQQKLDYSNDSTYNAIYKKDKTRYFQELEKHGKADCDVANTYFVALCRRAGVAARLLIGARINEASGQSSKITGSCYHAWAEIWDGQEWLSIDATPAGGDDEGDQQGGQQQGPQDATAPEEGTDIETNPPPKAPKQGDAKEISDALKAYEDMLRQQGEDAKADTLKGMMDKFEDTLKSKGEDSSKLLDELTKQMEKTSGFLSWLRSLLKKIVTLK